jgi:hypothetical protein
MAARKDYHELGDLSFSRERKKATFLHGLTVGTLSRKKAIDESSVANAFIDFSHPSVRIRRLRK